MRTLPDITRIYLYQSFIKTAINTAITVKLLTSKVTLLNTCEKLKMTHEKQLELILGIGYKVKGQLGSNAEAERSRFTERMRNGYGDKMRNGYGDKMRHFNEFFRLIFTLLCF
jgi:hypothetical protein